MPPRFLADQGRCHPIRIVADHEGIDGHLGGAPPQGIAPPGGLTYFLTVSFATDPDRQISIFVADYERLAPARGRINDLGLVKVIEHGPADRSNATINPSPLSPCGLVVLPDEEDWIDDEEGGRVVRSGHKLGGRPHLLRETAPLLEGVKQLTAQAFAQVLQVDFPGGDDAPVSGSWPFGDGIFGLFGRPPYAATDWRWWWDF
jgi:hypothetical protein